MYIASDILFACLCLYKHTPVVIHIYFRPESDDESLDLSPSSSLDIHKSHTSFISAFFQNSLNLNQLFKRTKAVTILL